MYIYIYVYMYSTHLFKVFIYFLKKKKPNQ